MTILILLSKHERSWSLLKEKIVAQPGAKRFLLCPINADLEETIVEIENFIRTQTSAQCAVVPFSRRLLEHSLRVKDDYIRFISELGNREVYPGVDLKEYFRYGSSDFSLWWVSLVYEKSPGKTDAFLRFVKLSLMITLAGENSCQELWISDAGENAMFVEALSGVQGFQVSVIGKSKRRSGVFCDARLFARESLRVLKYFLFLLAVRMRTPRHKRPAFSDGCRRFVITMFPFFDAQKFDQGEFYSKAYGPLQDGLEADREYPFTWLAMHTKIEPYTWQQSFQFARKAKSFAANFFSVDEWIGFGDILRIDVDLFKSVFKFVRAYSRLGQLTSWTMGRDCQVSLWPFLREDFISSFAGKVAVVNGHYLRIFLNIARDLPKGATVIHFAEMHGWERCLQIACGLRDDIKVVALQHAHVPQLLLNYFDHTEDLKDENLMRSVPQPDFLGSVGGVIRDYFLKQGWQKEKLFVVGGFRFQALLAAGYSRANTDKGRNILVAAFSICTSENLEMLKMLFKAFNGGAAEVKILIKSHPAESVEKMADKEGILLNKSVFEFTETPLERIVPDAGAMFACSTSAVFYAMACLKPVIVPFLYDAIDLCPLTNLYPYETRVDSHQQLLRIVSDVIAGRYDQSRHEPLRKRLFQDYLCLDENVGKYFENLNVYLRK